MFINVDNDYSNFYNEFSREHEYGFHRHMTDYNNKGDTIQTEFGGGIDFRLPFGTQFHIMQSAEDTDKVIAAFEEAIRQGYHPESVEQVIYQQLGVNPADFTWYDKDRISRKVNEIWASHETNN